MSTDEKILEELAEIRKLLTPPEPPAPPEGFVNEFKEFLKKYKVIGLAVAFILALYLGALVNSLVQDIIMPFVSLVIPDTTTINGELGGIELYPGGPQVMIWSFTGSLITFLIMALVMFLLIKLTSRMGLE